MNESCVRCGKQAAHRHHRKRRSQGGDDSPANLIPLCVFCHDWVHDNPEAAYATGYLVHSYDDPAEVPMEVTKGMKVDEETGALVVERPDHDHTGKCEVCGDTITKKQAKPRFQGEARRKRRVVAIRVPDDWEDGGGEWDETLEQTKAELVIDGLYESAERIPNFEAVMAGLRDYIDTRHLVRGFREDG